MTIIVQSVNEDVIALPASLLALLKLKEGDVIKTVVEGQTLRLTPLEQFLTLRGALQEDSAFDEALELLEEEWRAWTPMDSV